MTKPEKAPMPDEAASYRLLALVEEMVRRNASEREIALALRRVS